jgi:hypothetical protein
MHFDAGTRFYKDKRYPQALAEFTAGYELSKLPAFLFNIAQTYRQLGNLARAQEHYRTFIFLDPKSPFVAEAKRRLAEIDAQLPPSPSAPEPSPSPPVSSPPQPPVTPPSPPVTPPSPQLTAPSPPQLTPPPERRRRVFTWVGVGLTAGVIVAAGIVEGLASSDYNHDKNTCAPPHGTGCSNGQVNTLQLEINTATGLFVTGGVLAVATVVAAILEGRPRRGAHDLAFHF